MSDPNTSSRRSGLNRDVIAGIALLVFCGVTYWLTTGFDEPPSMLSQNVPPTFFPRLVLTAIALMAALLIVLGWRRGEQTRGPRVRPAVLLTAAVIVLATFLVGLIGTLATLSVVAFVLPLLWGERRWQWIILLCIGLPLAIYLVFTIALDVRFPLGSVMTAFR
jgi:putative tricarboxylic transport membrane protein